MRIFILSLTLVSSALADLTALSNGNGLQVDFSNCQTDRETGLCCVESTSSVISVQKDPILECIHKDIVKCHWTYKTEFSSAQEEVCDENYEKTCQIIFKQKAKEEKVEKCYRPIMKKCDGRGERTCKTVYETSCTTRYIDDGEGGFYGDTKCEKLPVEICGRGCTTEEGPEECHDKTITGTYDVPEELCDLNPQKTCRLQTKLVPRLSPVKECTDIPREVCHLKFSDPKEVDKPLKSKWCLDQSSAQSATDGSRGRDDINFGDERRGGSRRGDRRGNNQANEFGRDNNDNESGRNRNNNNNRFNDRNNNNDDRFVDRNNFNDNNNDRFVDRNSFSDDNNDRFVDRNNNNNNRFVDRDDSDGSSNNRFEEDDSFRDNNRNRFVDRDSFESSSNSRFEETNSFRDNNNRGSRFEDNNDNSDNRFDGVDGSGSANEFSDYDAQKYTADFY